MDVTTKTMSLDWISQDRKASPPVRVTAESAGDGSHMHSAEFYFYHVEGARRTCSERNYKTQTSMFAWLDFSTRLRKLTCTGITQVVRASQWKAFCQDGWKQLLS